MVRRDFELIANTIMKLQGVDVPQREQIAMQFAMSLTPMNPGFNFPKFIQESTGKSLTP